MALAARLESQGENAANTKLAYALGSYRVPCDEKPQGCDAGTDGWNYAASTLRLLHPTQLLASTGR